MIDNKIKILTGASILLVVVFFYVIINGFSSHSMQVWFNTPSNKITIGDIFILVIIHAVLNRSEIKK